MIVGIHNGRLSLRTTTIDHRFALTPLGQRHLAHTLRNMPEDTILNVSFAPTCDEPELHGAGADFEAADFYAEAIAIAHPSTRRNAPARFFKH